MARTTRAPQGRRSAMSIITILVIIILVLIAIYLVRRVV
jgi:flagellar biogenesis protein FliO